MSITAMQEALEALELLAKWEHPASNITTKAGGRIYPHRVASDAAAALRQAIEQAEQAQPVAWSTRESFYQALNEAVETTKERMFIKTVTMRCKDYDIALPVINIRDGHVLVGQGFTPPQRQWIGLTADEIWQCNTAPAGRHVEFHICVAHQNVLDFAEAIEAKLHEKNT